MAIKIVMGVPCSGKSHFIKENFPDKKVLDLYSYQEKLRENQPAKFFNIGETNKIVDYICHSEYEVVAKSYELIKDDMIECIKNKEDFIMEHTLLKAIRRKYYIDEIRKVTDEEIEIYVINPPDEKVVENSIKREVNYSLNEVKYHKEVLEIPTIEEGFSKVIIIEE